MLNLLNFFCACFIPIYLMGMAHRNEFSDMQSKAVVNWYENQPSYCPTIHSFTTSDLQKLTSIITHRPIEALDYTGRVIQVIQKTTAANDERTRIFLSLHNDYDTMYACPIFAKNEFESLDQIYYQYLLFDAAQGGYPDLFQEALDNGASLTEIDQRLNQINLVFRRDDGELCTLNDIDDGRAAYLEQSPKPFLGKSTCGWNVIDHANNHQQICILRKIKEWLLQIEYSQPDIERHPFFKLFNENKFQEAETQNEELLHAQLQDVIPTFNIKKACEIFNDQFITSNSEVHHIESCESNHIQFDALITKNDLNLWALTPMNTWKYSLPDLDALATLYGAILCFNQEGGKKIISKFDSWNKIPLFRDKVLSYAEKYLEKSLYLKESLIADNVSMVAQKILKSPCLVGNFSMQNFIMTTLRCFISNNSLKNHYNDLVDSLFNNPHGTTILYYMCQTEPTIFQKDIKNKFRRRILRPYLIKMLHHSQAYETPELSIQHLPSELIEYIASFWQPDAAFTQALRWPATK